MRLAMMLCLLAAGAVQAQEVQDTNLELEEIVVRAHPLAADGLAQASLVVEGETLARNLSSSLGETLARQPGVQNSSFGPAVGRPVIRGLGGARVRIMEDRLDTLDVSVTSGDHAVTVDPLITDRVEVLKGPSTLLYGSGAIGGVVNVETGRVPRQLRDGVTGAVEVRGEDSTEMVSTAGELDFGSGPLAFHADGFYRDGNDYDVPGCTESDELREAEGEEGCEEDDTLPGSDLETWGAAFGGTYIGERSYIGVAVSYYDNEYGLPGGHEHAHEHEHEEGEEEEEEEEGNAVLDLEQTRYELSAGYEEPLPGFANLDLRVVYNDYQHVEFEPNGEAGTEYNNEAWDTRLELTHREVLGFEGVVGGQYTYKEFSAIGEEEAFIDPVDTTSYAGFWVGERNFERFQLETGVRIEYLEHEPDPVRDLQFEDTDFTLFSASVGVVIPFGDSWRLGLTTDYSERAPVAEELYSFGPHLATNAFEIGDEDLDEESAVNFSATLDYEVERLRLFASAFYTSYSDYIYEFNTGQEDEESELPIFQFAQDDADFYGFELGGSLRALEYSAGELWLNLGFDYVDAELDVDGNDNVPRLAPARYMIGAEGTWSMVTARIDYMYVDEQDDVTEFELTTDDYEDLRIYLGANFPANFGDLQVFVQGKNLTDDEQRYHTSFIKDVAPQPGRTVEAGMRIAF